MLIFHPLENDYSYLGVEAQQIMQQTIDWFEAKGKKKLTSDDRNYVWYDDFLSFTKANQLFAKLMTPQSYGGEKERWDTARIAAFTEICAFYGLCYWYTYQVSSLGLGPIWMSDNERAKERAAQLLREGHVFAFGLSEKEHGADIYSTSMQLAKQADGTYLANGRKYYIGNGNKAGMIAVFGRLETTNDYVWFVVDSQHPNYHLLKNIVNNQSYVAEFELKDYPIEEQDILHLGAAAWDAAMNTVNLNKYNLGWGSIGICSHMFYESINHAGNRRLFDHFVTDFPHIKALFIKAYARLVAMRLFTSRAADYLRSASLDDRRYLLYNALVKMKVTREGEKVVDDLWDIIAAKGFENDTYFNIGTRDIRALPKLEGTVHVNMALVVKFIANYFFNSTKYPPIPERFDAANDDFVFQQGPARGISKILFHDYTLAYDSYDLPNVNRFKRQIETFKEFLLMAGPNQEQRKDIDFLLTIGELFSLVVYGQLILEKAKLQELGESLIDQLFEVFVADFSHFSLQIYNKPSSTEKQMAYALKMLVKPDFNPERTAEIWDKQVFVLKDSYAMNEEGVIIET